MQLKTCEKITRSPAYKFVCATIILQRHLTNLSNTVAKNAPKFSKVCSSRTKTNVLQSIPSNSFTITYRCSKFQPFGHTSLQAQNFAAGEVNTAHEVLKNYAPIYRHRRSDAKVRDAHKIIKRRCLRFALVTNYKVKNIRTFKRYEEHAANMAQRTCLIRAKNVTSLKFYFFLYDDIFGIKLADTRLR